MMPAGGYEFRGERIPEHMGEPLEAWVRDGRQPGHFLTAVLKNNLTDAIGRADPENLRALPAFIGWLYNEAPGPCWGSKQAVDEWEASHEKRRRENGTETKTDGD